MWNIQTSPEPLHAYHFKIIKLRIFTNQFSLTIVTKFIEIFRTRDQNRYLNHLSRMIFI